MVVFLPERIPPRLRGNLARWTLKRLASLWELSFHDSSRNAGTSSSDSFKDPQRSTTAIHSKASTKGIRASL
jgi:hypothetical protein